MSAELRKLIAEWKAAPSLGPRLATRARLDQWLNDHAEAIADVIEAADNYAPRDAHDWRCEYRTAKVGWKPGDPPVIKCECGYDELMAALAKVSQHDH